MAIIIRVDQITPESTTENLFTKNFSQDEVTLGRSGVNDLVLSEPDVSGKHAKLILKRAEDAPRLCVIDLKSSNGTYVEDRKIPAEQPYELQEQDRIVIGSFVLRAAFISQEEKQEGTTGTKITAAEEPLAADRERPSPPVNGAARPEQKETEPKETEPKVAEPKATEEKTPGAKAPEQPRAAREASPAKAKPEAEPAPAREVKAEPRKEEPAKPEKQPQPVKVPEPAKVPANVIEPVKVTEEDVARIRSALFDAVVSQFDAARKKDPKATEESVSNAVKEAIRTNALALLETENATFPENGILRDVHAEIMAAGPLSPLLEDKETTELYVDSVQDIFRKKGFTVERVAGRFSNEHALERAVSHILGRRGVKLPAETAAFSTEADSGYKVSFVRSASGCSFVFKRGENADGALSADESLSASVIGEKERKALLGSVREGKSALLTGESARAASGLLLALFKELPEGTRVVAVVDDDSKAASLPVKSVFSIPPAPSKSKAASVTDTVVEHLLLLRPDYILFSGGASALWTLIEKREESGATGALIASVQSCGVPALVREIQQSLASQRRNIAVDEIRRLFEKTFQLKVMTEIGLPLPRVTSVTEISG